MKIYISGQITGLDYERARELFQAGADAIWASGNDPTNPMQSDTPGLTWGEYMAKDFLLIEQCQGMYMLSNWQESRGARIEHAIAKEMGLKIYYEASDLG